MEEQKQAQRINQERTPFVCILESLWLVENTESVEPDCKLISLTGGEGLSIFFAVMEASLLYRMRCQSREQPNAIAR